ncbi:MAG TPA: sugar phosphate isomerase/epimerase, partial [Sphingomicrobium sp.]|nr:sugar phosphate isomerase/epimerase [Sphingomicrobium sp.]
LALHHLTVREVPVVELIEIAASLECSDVCVFTHAPRIPIPGAAFTEYPTVNDANKLEILAALSANGVGVGNIEFFPVTEALDLDDYVPAFEVGAQIGARRAVTHIHDTDSARAVDTLGQLCDLAAKFDLKLGLEFMGLTPACNSIQRAQWYVTEVGRKNIGIAMDALHLIRTGGTPDDIAAIATEQFCYAQICDGLGLHVTADYRPEGQDRKAPGDGDWPLTQIFAALPEITPIDVEVPSTTQVKMGIPAIVRARHAVDRARELMSGICSAR